MHPLVSLQACIYSPKIAQGMTIYYPVLVGPISNLLNLGLYCEVGQLTLCEPYQPSYNSSIQIVIEGLSGYNSVIIVFAR